MAMTALNGRLMIPTPLDGADSAAPTIIALNTLDVSGEAVAFVFRAPKAGTLDKAEFLLGLVINTPDNGIRVSFQSLTGANPDDIQDQFRDVTSGLTTGAWIVPGLMTSDGTDGGVKRTVTAGEPMAIVIEFVTFVASDSFNIRGISATNTVSDKLTAGQQYTAARTSAGVWSRFPDMPSVVLKYDDGSYATIGIASWYPWTVLNTTTFNSGSTPDERGLIFQLPVSMRCVGAWVRLTNTNASDLVLYDAANGVVDSVALDTYAQSGTAQNFFVPFDPVTLTANVNYRLVVKPGASNVSTYDFDVNSTTLMGTIPGGATWHYTSRTDAGAWTEVTTKRPWMGLVFDGVDVGGGATLFVPVE